MSAPTANIIMNGVDHLCTLKTTPTSSQAAHKQNVLPIHNASRVSKSIYVSADSVLQTFESETSKLDLIAEVLAASTVSAGLGPAFGSLAQTFDVDRRDQCPSLRRASCRQITGGK